MRISFSNQTDSEGVITPEGYPTGAGTLALMVDIIEEICSKCPARNLCRPHPEEDGILGGCAGSDLYECRLQSPVEIS